MANNSNLDDTNLEVNMPVARAAPDPERHSPGASPPGVQTLYLFFVSLMNDAIRGIVCSDTEPMTTDALGFDPVGPIITRRRMDEYTVLLNSNSIANDTEFSIRTPRNECVVIRAARHAMWINTVVPKALQHAHRHISCILENHPTPDMADYQGHINVVKLFMALLDQAVNEVIGARLMRRFVAAHMLEGYTNVHASHYMGTFGRRAPPLHWYSMTFVDDAPNENI